MAGYAARLLVFFGLAASVSPAQVVMMGPGGGRGQAMRGSVTAVSGDTITAKGADGNTYKVIVTANTRIMSQAQGQMTALKVTDIKPGEAVVAMGQTDEAQKEVHAAMVMVLSAEQAAAMEARAKELQASLGKTWIAGKITAMDEAKLTIERQDKVSQVIEADENTSFRRGGMIATLQGNGGMGFGGGMRRGGQGNGQGESGGMRQGPAPDGEAITLADFKVGDSIMADGSVQHGVFVPKTLHLVPQRRGGPRGPGGPGGQQPPSQQ